MKSNKSNYLFYFLVASMGLTLTYWFRTMQEDTLRMWLYPHAIAVKIFYNIPINYIEGIGYSSNDGMFAIGRECMGYNFIVMMFGMNACVFVKHFKGLNKVLWLFISLISAILMGILVSSIRIIGSISLVAHEKFTLIHSGVGIAFYFFALAVSYMIAKKFVGREKLEQDA